MKSTGIVRRVDELGRIVLPMELRKSMEIGEKAPLEIYVEGNSIILKKHQCTCISAERRRTCAPFRTSTSVPPAWRSSTPCKKSPPRTGRRFSVPRYSFLAGTSQMFRAYSRMLRSAAKMPDRAMFTSAIRFHRPGSR